VCISQANERNKTHDGLKICGSRLVQEICLTIKNRIIPEIVEIQNTGEAPRFHHVTPEILDEVVIFEENEVQGLNDYDCPENVVISFSVIAHSLGGLISRYALPYVLREFTYLEPFEFLTMASPHLGIRRPGGNIGQKILKYYAEMLCLKFYGQTGQEIYLNDEFRLLETLTDPEAIYWNALNRFRHVTLISAPHHDFIVPYVSSSVQFHNHYPKVKWFLNPPFFIIGHNGFSEDFNDFLPENIHFPIEEEDNGEDMDNFIVDNVREMEYLKRMVINFNKLQIRRLDVFFRSVNTHGLYILKGIIYKKPGNEFNDRVVDIILRDESKWIK